LAVSVLSYTLLERPIRTGRLVRGPGAWIAAPAAAALVAAAVVPLTGSLVTVGAASARVLATRQLDASGDAASSSFALGPGPASAAALAATASAIVQPSSEDGAPTSVTTAGSSGPVPAPTPNTAASSPNGAAVPALAANGQALAPRNTPARVLVVGDSTANALAPGLVQWGHDTALADVDASAIRIGCGFVTTGRDKFGAKPRDIAPLCGQVQRQLADAAAVSKADVALVVDGVWEVTDHQAPGDSWRAVGDPVYDGILAAAITAVTTRLLEHVPVVVWVTSPHIHPGWGFAGEDPAWDPQRMDRFNELLATTVSAMGPRVMIIDYARWLNERPAGLDADFRPDGVHVSPVAARTVADWLGPQLVALAPAS
jgi:SGNH domain (fused to AT3 domains)